jgi:hypothetical protein
VKNDVKASEATGRSDALGATDRSDALDATDGNDALDATNGSDAPDAEVDASGATGARRIRAQPC